MAPVCVAACCRLPFGNGRSGYMFPKDEKLRKLWSLAANPSRPTWKPSKRDKLCAAHFLDEDFETNPKVLISLGLSTKYNRLKEGAVPSVFSRKRKAERRSKAFEKRQRKEIVDSLLATQDAGVRETSDDNRVVENIAHASTSTGGMHLQDGGLSVCTAPIYVLICHTSETSNGDSKEKPAVGTARRNGTTTSLTQPKEAPLTRNAQTQTTLIYRNRGTRKDRRSCCVTTFVAL
ncbi:uncharacterized protein LOC135365977 [Ornithodoros turicata]|uniref:uncharacterized protein LOC135365977 n=1 Tax=Ornithodoros turicata TaxID=34597 RepID=UPI0031398188